MPLLSLTVIWEKSALYCGLSAASAFSQTPLMPLSGSMYHSVSSATCCRPLDCDPALIAQMLNHPAFLMVPSGFSRISSSLRGMFCGMPCAWPGLAGKNSCGASAHTTSSNARMRLIVFSLIAAIVCTLVMGAILEAAKPMNNQNRDLYPKIGFTCGSYWRPIPIADFLGG